MTSMRAGVLALSLLVAACGSESTPSADTGSATTAPPATEVPATEPPATDPPPTEPPATDPPPTEPPATDPPPTEPPPTEPPATAPPTTDPPAPTAGTAVVYGGTGGPFPWVPLAWWDGGGWNQAGYTDDGAFVVPPPPSIGTVSATSLDLPDGPGQVIDGLSLGPEDFYCVGDETGPTIQPEVAIPDTAQSLGYDALAVTADWPLQPRPVQQIGADNPEYAAIGASFVDAPTAAAGTVSQAVRVDLDGDGVEEVLVTYEYLTDSQFGAEDDFSVVFARFAEPDGTVVDQLLELYVLDDPTDFPTIGRFTIAAVADLNGDGVMEIATRSSFWESAGITVWALDGDGLAVVGGGGCGV